MIVEDDSALPRHRRVEIVKRLMDLWLAIAALVLLSPLLACVAVALWAIQGRPIFFRQQRPGLDEHPFLIVKFRTMREPTGSEVAFDTDDLRVTRLGRLLRSTSIDELPELWNVVRGDMSLVGPRPLLMEYLASYTPRQRRRHTVRPGVTSWAAVNGRHSRPFEERLELDVWYVDHRTMALDLRIILMTISQVLRRTDVTTTQDVAEIGFPLPGSTRPREPEADER